MKNLLQLALVLCLICTSSTLAQDNKTMYVFGHSLIVHATSSDETTVPHWLHLLAQEAGHTISVSGQYGFLPQHADLPPIAQWGFSEVPSAWESDTQEFSEANFNTILLTAANFIQYQPSNVNYHGNPTTSPLSATLDIVDWIDNQEESAVTYIYENWPDMATFIAGEGFPPSGTEFENYNNYTTGDFHNWWIDYQDYVQAARPSENVRMIPVGPVLSKLLTDTPLSQVPILELYEDNAPHGEPTLYFLAGLITYMAIYEEKAPVTYTIPNTVNALVQSNFQSTIDFIWNELLAFNYSNGSSRVFNNNPLHTDSKDYNELSIFPNPTKDIIKITNHNFPYTFELFDSKGLMVNQKFDNVGDSINISNLSDGLYFLKIQINGNQVIKKIVKH
ncbi:T9SS type A sorting domain-containing protein [Hyunsoonleella sp. SJ7]|uniref:T9SS type A sorting domain-containing protein n=1 Tax=Hyunsoonleella aquatilis TaxID=2762758 RepID=A0A923HA84_9FLAO|nr:T9SS type A sorting domain-containing protein [Hyunsoonleella aquatilis]MBC3759670.1 T9SS type A sorting domain-containing protein [Hyunsoonleella aquatilis]